MVDRLALEATGLEEHGIVGDGVEVIGLDRGGDHGHDLSESVLAIHTTLLQQHRLAEGVSPQHVGNPSHETQLAALASICRSVLQVEKHPADVFRREVGQELIPVELCVSQGAQVDAVSVKGEDGVGQVASAHLFVCLQNGFVDADRDLRGAVVLSIYRMMMIVQTLHSF